DGSSKDGKLSETEISKVEEIDISSKSIGNLKGIEYFTNLKKLDCHSNSIKELGLSRNTALRELNCSSNSYNGPLDLSYNRNLQKVNCYYNSELTAINLSNGDNITYLDCSYCALTLLSLIQCSNLETLYCYNNKIEKLDLSSNKKLTKINCKNNCLTSLDLSKLYAKPDSFDASGNSYTVKILEGATTFDMTTLPGGFDAGRMSSLTNASINPSVSHYIDNPEGLAGKTVTYKYDTGKDYKIDFKIEFEELVVKSIAWKTKPTGTFYQGTPAAELFSGCTLEVTFDDDTTGTIAVKDSMVSGYDPSKTTRQTVTITYGGKTTTFTVTLTALRATVLKLSEIYPPKSTFILGEAFDVGSGELYAEFNNGYKGNIEMDVPIVEVDSSKFDSSKPGTYTITVKVFGKSITYKVNVVLDPATAPVILSDGISEYPFATLTDAFKKITELKKNDTDYTVTVKSNVREGALTFPKAAKSLTIITTGTGTQIKTTSTTLTFATTTTLGSSSKGAAFTHIDNKGNPDGKLIGIKCAASTDASIYGYNAWAAVSGTATTDLYIEGGTVESLATFRNAEIGSLLDVNSKVSGITKLVSGSLRLTDYAKGSVTITTVDYGFFTLASGLDSKGKLMFPKVTVSDVTNSLSVKIIDSSNDAVQLTSGTPVMTVGNGGNTASIESKVSIVNKDGSKVLKPFVYKTEVRAEFPDALTLEGVGKLPNFEQAFMKVDPTGDNIITLHMNMAPAAFVLPAKAGSITIRSDSAARTLTLPKLTALAPAYDFTLENLNVKSEGAGTFAINGKKSVTVNNCSIYPTVSISAGADSTLTLGGSETEFGKLSGTKTTTLAVNNHITASEAATFGDVQIMPAYRLTILGKVSGVEKLSSGSLRLSADKTSSAVIKEIGTAELALNYYEGALAKVTVTDVSGKLTVKLLNGWTNTQAVIPSGTPVLTVGGTEDFTDRIEILNKDSSSHALNAFLYNKEIRAEYANAIYLNDTPYPNFEQAFKNIDPNGTNIIELNEDVAPDKFALPAKAGTQLTITSRGSVKTLTLPNNVTTLAPAYQFTLKNVNIVSEAKSLTINGKSSITVYNCSITPVPSISVGANSILDTMSIGMSFTKLSGTKTSTLNVNGCIHTVEVSTFGNVNISSGSILSVGGDFSGGKVSGIEKLNGDSDGTGTLRMHWADKTVSVTINEVCNATLKLCYDDGAVSKTTVNKISDKLTLMIYNFFTNTLTELPSGTTVLTMGGTENFTDKIDLKNKDTSSNALKPFLYKKEIRAENDEVLTLRYSDGTADKKFRNFEALVSHIDEREAQLKKEKKDPQSYYITVNSSIAAGKLTLPKTAKKITIRGVGGTGAEVISMTATATLAPKYDLNLENIVIENHDANFNEAGFTINQSTGELYIAGLKSDTLTGITGGANATLSFSYHTLPNLEKITGFGLCYVVDDFTACKTFSVGTLRFTFGKTVTVPKDSKVTIKDIINNEPGSAFVLNTGFTPITISGSVTGSEKIKLRSETGYMIDDDTQILNAAKCDLGMFDVSGISGGSDEYTLSRSGSKVYCKYGYFSMAGVLYASLDDVSAAIEALNAKDAEYTVYVLNDIYSKSFKLPKAGTYSKLTLTAGEQYTISFSGNITLTGNTVIDGIKLVSKDNNGNIAKYTITPAKNCSFTAKGGAYLGKLTGINGANSTVVLNGMSFSTDEPIKITADKFEYGTVTGIIDTLTCNTIGRIADCPALGLLMKKSCTNTVKTGISNNLNIGIFMVNADNEEAEVPADTVIFTTFKGTVFDGHV
ncbi:MAG: bacterial Ig-like domain-containing protein, partial [Ruminiclostridium sp.]|nr:bacterial Ig-like domain-containing protein [Ruminiclostridium sp.]